MQDDWVSLGIFICMNTEECDFNDLNSERIRCKTFCRLPFDIFVARIEPSGLNNNNMATAFRVTLTFCDPKIRL